MLPNIYFASARDTSIANRDESFIRSLKIVCTKTNPGSVVERAENADIVLVDERYDYRTWRYRDELIQCAFLRRHGERVCVINHDCYSRVFLPGLYVSLDCSQPPLLDACSAPYKRDLWQVPVADFFEFSPQNLFAFRGTFHTHSIRKKLFKALENSTEGNIEELHKAFHKHDCNDQEIYIQQIRNAAFSLCPRGLSPHSYRLYESMQLGRCPVVISDNWIPPTGPNWEEFVVRIEESNIRSTLSLMLKQHDQAKNLGKKAQAAWKEYFSWPARYRTFLNLVERFHGSRENRFSMEDMMEIWHGREIHKLYSWTIFGRARQRLRNTMSNLLEKPPPG